MPNVTATPVKQSNGDILTSFVDSVETTTRTYTFAVMQKSIRVTNKGSANITLTINATPYTILPGQVQSVTADFTSIQLQASSKVQHFEAVATTFDTKPIVANSSWNGGNLLQLGNYYLWVDASNRLRIKSGVPTSDTDGAVVGTQA